MKQILFIIPYFGKFNNYFQLFLNSCEKNRDICDWLIFTDDKTQYKYPTNVKVIYLNWAQMQEYIQSKFDFPISLNRPYKLCDFKPAYGYIFEEYIADYEFWGHCDTDLIWGCFRSFWTEDIFINYKKIFNLGHCCIYHNDFTNNRIFLRPLNGEEQFKKIYTHDNNCSFDEEYNDSINNIYQQYYIPIFESSFAANLYTKTSNFRLTEINETFDGYIVEKKIKNFFVWNNGTLKRFVYKNGEVFAKEYLYIHFQARKMKVNLHRLENNCFKIVPNAFEELEINEKNINVYNFSNVKCKHFNLHYFTLRTSNFIKKIRKRVNRKW